MQDISLREKCRTVTSPTLQLTEGTLVSWKQWIRCVYDNGRRDKWWRENCCSTGSRRGRRDRDREAIRKSGKYFFVLFLLFRVKKYESGLLATRHLNYLCRTFCYFSHTYHPKICMFSTFSYFFLLFWQKLLTLFLDRSRKSR